ncbi:MAG: T9SS type A sorting domain-containing protein, partial [Flavobacteriaceae bacterium]|nr:T9SS type A sorting domain-containing protein [Flavobacteriaceae bacterium]
TVSNEVNSDTDEVTVVVDPLPATDAGLDIDINFGESTTLTASGGDSYLWSTGENAQSIIVSPVETTTYAVTSFINDCQNSDNVVVIVNYPVIASAGDDTVICEGQETILTASGGDDYLWSNGETTASIAVSPNSTTTYFVTVSDENSSDTDEVTVTVNPLPAVNAGSDVTIFNGESATLTASGEGSYLWNTGQTTQSIDVHPNATRTYSVTIYENECEASDDVVVFVEASENVIANAGDDQNICEGEYVTLSASGGLYFLWSNGATTASISVNPNETTVYSVTVSNDTDSATDEVTVIVNPVPLTDAGDNVTITEGDITTLSASGGDTYLWSTGETTSSISVSPNATTTYSVTAFINNCEASDEVIVTVEGIPAVTADAGADQTICSGSEAILTASGGDTYLWSTGETTTSITVNPNETITYSVTVTDGITTDIDEVTVFVNPVPAANAGTNVTISEGESTTLTASGGDTYLWSTGETTQSITVIPNATATYSVTAYINDCEASDEVTVTVEAYENVTADAGADQTICIGSEAQLTASGGDTYLWSTGATTASITVSPNANLTYSVSVSDGITTDTDDVTVNVNPLPNANAGNDVTITQGESTILTASGGDTYLWSTGATSKSISVSPSESKTYDVIVYSNGCEATADVTVTVEDSTNVIADAGENQNLCQGDETTLTASGGTSYLWSTGQSTQSIQVEPTSTTNYTVVVSNGTSSDSDEVTVIVNQRPEVNVTSNKAMILNGDYVTLSATGANEYLWNNGATQPNIAIAPFETTTYSVTGYNNDCSDQESITVDVLDYVIADAGIDETICFGETITLTASATGGDVFVWNTGQTTKSITVNPDEDTTYSVIVSNELDSHADQVTVFVQNCDIEEVTEFTTDPFMFEVYFNQRATNDLNVKIAGLTDETQLFLHDILGKRIYFETLDANNGQEFVKHISLENISSGVYVITLRQNGRNKTKKVLLE